MEPDEIKRLTELSLTEKIEHAKSIIAEGLERFSQDALYVAWTGGKDSTTMLWLYREACKALGKPLPKTMFIDEGSVFEEIWALVEQVKNLWNVEVAVVKNTDVSAKAEQMGGLIRVADLNPRNRAEVAKLEFNDEFFPFEPESFVGNHLMKTVAMNVFLEDHAVQALSTAIRWDEQHARVKEQTFSPRANPAHIRIHPILHFKERDIWETIHVNKIPYCSLYCQGYRSLGAKGSTFKSSDIPAWKQDLENTTERAGRGQAKEQVMEKLRDLGYM